MHRRVSTPLAWSNPTQLQTEPTKPRWLCTGDVIHLKDEHHRAATLNHIRIETLHIYTDLTSHFPKNRDRGHDHAVSQGGT